MRPSLPLLPCALHAFFLVWTMCLPAIGQGQALARGHQETAVAVADPWVYNEYTDGRNLPPAFDNLGGAVELVNWLLEQVAHGTRVP